MRFFLLLYFCTVFLPCLFPSPCISENWQEISDGFIPLPQSSHSMIHDAVLNRFLIYGVPNKGITCEYSNATKSWQLFNTVGTPTQYAGHTAIYNNSLNTMVIFGGSDGSTQTDELWSLNLMTGVWSKITAAMGPSPRQLATSVFDHSNNRMIIFGGQEGSLALNDVWEFDFTLNKWNIISFTRKPAPRWGAISFFDFPNNRMILIGGRDDTSTYFNDVWELDFTLNTWTRLTIAGVPPTARAKMGGIYDYINNRLVIYGGEFLIPVNDVWELSLTTLTWAPITTVSTPLWRRELTCGFDALRMEMIMFGGKGAFHIFNDTWTLDLNSNEWTEVSEKPSERREYSFIYNEYDETSVVFGGLFHNSDHLNDLWFYHINSSQWEKTHPGGLWPEPRKSHAAIYDSLNRRMILFGGQQGSTYFSDTWEYSFVTDEWSEIHTIDSPDPRAGHSFVLYPGQDKAILFGGYNGLYQNDTWEFDIATNHWLLKTPLEYPPVRDNHGSCPLSSPGNILLFGGYAVSGDLRDTWQYNIPTGEWNQLYPSVSPPANSQASMIQTSDSERIILFGGLAGTNETWIFNEKVGDWNLLSTSSPPSVRWGHNAVYDSDNNRMLLFAGSNSESGNPDKNDLWELTGFPHAVPFLHGYWSALMLLILPPLLIRSYFH